ncbi:MAG: Zn-dependent hydrolase [Anaerolineales bacterium]
MMRVDSDRLQSDFDQLAQFGAFTDGEGHAGVNRPALSAAHLEARQWFLARAAEAGLETRVDAAGNHSAILPGGSAAARTLLLGSHLDSVPNGGRYDGALGLLAGLECLRVIKEAGLVLPVHLEAIDFTDEEGTLVGELGSGALAGTLSPGMLRQPRGGRQHLLDSLARAGLDEARLNDARRDPAGLAGFLELHIEQGPRLEHAGVDIGVVTAIVGITSYRLTYRGAANHAGTTPIRARHDAGVGAAAFLLAVRERVLSDFPDGAVNIGQMRFEPGAYNIVPGAAEFALEFRAPDAAGLSEMDHVLLRLAEKVGREHGLSLEREALGGCAPAGMGARAQAAIAAAAGELGLSYTDLVSGAGHDGQNLAPLTEAGMVFIPSRAGVSHSPREFSEWGDCVNGANVLLNAALRLAEEA